MATTTLAPKTTRSGRPKLPALDKNRILAEQTKLITEQVTSIADPKERLAKLAEIEFAAHDVIAECENPMKKQALSLALHEGARSVYKAIGMSREAFSRMTADALGDWSDRPKAVEGVSPWGEAVVARATEQGVRFYRNAATTLPEIALKVVTAKAQEVAVRPLRNELVRELYDVHGLKRTEIAEIIGRTPSRVSHITKAG